MSQELFEVLTVGEVKNGDVFDHYHFLKTFGHADGAFVVYPNYTKKIAEHFGISKTTEEQREKIRAILWRIKPFNMRPKNEAPYPQHGWATGEGWATGVSFETREAATQAALAAFDEIKNLLA